MLTQLPAKAISTRVAKRPPSEAPAFAPSGPVSHVSAFVPDGTVNRSRTDPGSLPFSAFTASGWPSASTLNPSPARIRPIPASFAGRISTSRGTDVSYVAFHSSGNVAAATGSAPVKRTTPTDLSQQSKAEPRTHFL